MDILRAKAGISLYSSALRHESRYRHNPIYRSVYATVKAFKSHNWYHGGAEPVLVNTVN